jgi:uncharacterized protein (DUF952 family)
MIIYKILRAPEWADLQSLGATAGAPIDIADGYIHFSTKEQAAETASKHFAGVDGLILVAFETDTITGPLKWEKSRNDDLFPHLYGPLTLSDAVWHAEMPWNGTHHVMPEEFGDV